MSNTIKHLYITFSHAPVAGAVAFAGVELKLTRPITGLSDVDGLRRQIERLGFQTVTVLGWSEFMAS
jgi:hypothetical protein